MILLRCVKIHSFIIFKMYSYIISNKKNFFNFLTTALVNKTQLFLLITRQLSVIGNSWWILNYFFRLKKSCSCIYNMMPCASKNWYIILHSFLILEFSEYLNVLIMSQVDSQKMWLWQEMFFSMERKKA